jgi:hypothetical protein
MPPVPDHAASILLPVTSGLWAQNLPFPYKHGYYIMGKTVRREKCAAFVRTQVV